MSHKNTGVRAVNPGNPGTGPGTGGVPATQADLQALRAELLALLNQQDDPLRFRKIVNADITNATIESAKIGSLAADKITAGSLLATIDITTGKLRTATSGERLELDTEGVFVYDASDDEALSLTTDGLEIQVTDTEENSDGVRWFRDGEADGSPFMQLLATRDADTNIARWRLTNFDDDADSAMIMQFQDDAGTTRARVRLQQETVLLETRDSGNVVESVIELAANRVITLSGVRVIIDCDTRIEGDLDHDGSGVGFYSTTPIAKQTGVAVSAAGIHAALVNLGLISA